MKKIAYIDDFEKWKKEFSFYIEVPVRFSETDMFGHVNNVSPFIYFEQARIEYFVHLNVYSIKFDTKDVPVVADLQCDFIRQMYFGDTLKIYVKANSVGNTSVDIHYLGVNQDDDICLIGRGRLVNIDAKTGKPVKFSDDVRNKFLNN